MKKTISILLFLLLCVSISQAQLLIGGRASGMGGAGVAASDDISAAYYNPAALMRSDVKLTQVTVDLGAAYSDMTILTKALSNSNTPAKFMLDNYANNLNFNGNVFGLIGINARKIGLSVIPQLSTVVNKPAGTLGGNTFVGGHIDGVLTLGYTFSVPVLPAALDLGVNLKSINGVMGSAILTTANPPTTATGVEDYGTGSGTGFDIGVLTSFNVPFVSKIAVGAVLRDLASSYTLKLKEKVTTADQLTGIVTEGPETARPDATINIGSATVLGAYATLPVVGLGVAGDIEMVQNSDTNIHLGVEYPMFLNTLFLRAGVASGPNLGLVTAGIEANLRVIKLGLVTISDSKHSGLTSAVADISFGL